MLDDALVQLCQDRTCVTSELAKDPSTSPAAICKRVFAHHAPSPKLKGDPSYVVTDEDLGRAVRCGNWGKATPSTLFLQTDPLMGVCSPRLLGSNGVCPLTVIATIPDICRHMSNLIARAQHEVFIATNYWASSEGASLISHAIRELDRRAGQEGRRAVIKVMYDRGDLRQFVHQHQAVSPDVYADPEGPITLPHPKDLANVDIEVVNYHKPLVGIFHAKFMCVDRRIAILQSNNIQDNDNLEMMTQFEGDIVDSIYDMCLISWGNQLHPPLPCLSTPAAGLPSPTFSEQSFQSLFESASQSDTHPSPVTGTSLLQGVATDAAGKEMAQHTSAEPHYDGDVASEVKRAIASLNPQPGERRIESVSRLLNGPAPNNQGPQAPDIEAHDMITPVIPIAPHEPFPIAMVNRPPHGAVTFHSIGVPQDAAFISALRYAKSTIFMQTPDLNAQGLIPEIVSACRRGVRVTYYYCLGYNDAGELLPHQGGHNEAVAHNLLHEVGEQYLANLEIYAYVAKDQIAPIHNKLKKRSCHIKLLVADGHVGVQGSGNQDTQSWYHSQEVNVLIDSELVCAQWMAGIRQNQNTHLYGRVMKTGAEAGCWVHPVTGQQPEAAIGVDPGKFAWAKGAIGAIAKVRGVGGF